MKTKTVAFCTLGCKVNQYETNAMEQEFLKKGYEVVDFSEISDIYIINTCSVTNIAERKSRQMIRRAKTVNPLGIVAVCGCYSQVAKNEIEKIPEVDLILGVNEKNNIVDFIEKYKKEKIENVSDISKQSEFVEFGTTSYSEKTRAVIKIQDGCNQFCTYCIIPYARGRVRSRKLENILKEAQEIAKKGIKEIVITGIHIASYGKDFENEDTKLIDVLESLNEIDGIERIRLSSIEPTIMTDEFVSRLLKLNKICDHFHLSLQSGYDETLKRMNRHYTTKEFMDVVNRIRNAYKDAALTTDVIVGFPGETEEEFEKTYKFLDEVSFYKMHIFPYSAKKGTVAAKMPNQISKSEKEKRSKKLIQLSNEKESSYNQKEIGKKLEVLWEERQDDYILGHTKNYRLVKMKSKEENFENKIEIVQISNVSDDGAILIATKKED